jgi:predicted phosphodiesterase
MRIFAVSDVHADYDANAKWVSDLSSWDHRDDILILAGDVTDSLPLLGSCLRKFVARFRKVLYVPGNHELWMRHDTGGRTSLDKFAQVIDVCNSSGCLITPYREADVTIVPLLGWYDYSFGPPSDDLKMMWMDYRQCRWPDGFEAQHAAEYFSSMSSNHRSDPAEMVITFSHFLPRIDLMPNYVPESTRALFPVLGSTRIEHQLRQLNSKIHVYGHSHLNRSVVLDGVRYINNAFGYPNETRIASKHLRLIKES